MRAIIVVDIVILLGGLVRFFCLAILLLNPIHGAYQRFKHNIFHKFGHENTESNVQEIKHSTQICEISQYVVAFALEDTLLVEGTQEYLQIHTVLWSKVFNIASEIFGCFSLLEKLGDSFICLEYVENVVVCYNAALDEKNVGRLA